MKFSQLKKITQGHWLQKGASDPEITHLLTDSRKVIVASGAVFFAIKGEHHDGHAFLEDIYRQGVRLFVVEDYIDFLPDDAYVLEVNSSIEALQQIATEHRERFRYPVIGITGSNGKTIVKEWLAKALGSFYQVVRSPKSYNSQIGVPLSVWQMSETDQIGIFEAGISKPGEMKNLEAVINPSIGIFTNIGSAHDENFLSRQQKIEEKIKLFHNCKSVIYCSDHEDVDELMNLHIPSNSRVAWSFKNREATVHIYKRIEREGFTLLNISYKWEEFSLRIPYTDAASVENAMHVVACLLVMGVASSLLQQTVLRLEPVSMRLELKQGVNGTYLINDTYNNDLAGLEIALDFLAQQKQREKKTLILSDILQSGLVREQLYAQVAILLKQKHIDRLIGIGPEIEKEKALFSIPAEFYASTEQFLASDLSDKFKNELVLIKGARAFGFERIANRLQEKIHGTVLEINLDALTHNLNFYRAQLAPNTRLMVMVKAFAYGSGSHEIANLLQFHKVDYLAVAYPDEGVALRQNGIHLPIMVMNPSPESIDKLLRFNLEPEVYSLEILQSIVYQLSPSQEIGIHLKLDTGMKRLGFEEEQMDALCEILLNTQGIRVKSIFTHLAGSDEAVHNGFSHAQVMEYENMYASLTAVLPNKPLRHVLNSPGILRFPEYHFDMVRLGIGLYGVEVSGLAEGSLQSISRLKTTISQIKTIAEGETVGYSRTWKAARPTRSATIGIGYADGFDRGFSNGVGKVVINGKLAPVIGNVCMDMTMVDITDIEAQVGDEVIIFGEQYSVADMAQSIGTIPYEILTNVSERVKRVFYTE
ncbi:bifunctional UDP-N-acetylmuramoyl-tripeptide:D-alanyl-D-alanine ligase/alanine racemase [Cytophagales bacterium LB-30]|uniref:Alanine racemase n=1 Tax=Shiella aurantiaca TaxID=3058365 RepID=A0ABT8F6I7_9BACT|nr:bifunctional UDP-N-acetylmuramoyl-tripeptide:D-alanyl-D-alanine ligase/alanine racemase [Shiella aurantiaca]MDN4166096.1 bifunctional UDP-N-acetylmuramoyl-tripeptide:D-alanyl-D-alanine ligase/alanine racemase [Shiella aurantiaca]